jgi:prolyl-tRNA synthetase-like protein
MIFLYLKYARFCQGARVREYISLRRKPVCVELGPKDIEKGQAAPVRRDTGEKEFVERKGLAQRLHSLMTEIQENMLEVATQFRDANTRHAETYDEFREIIEEKRGFVVAPWDGTEETEQRIKEETKATIRLLPFDSQEGKDLVSGKPGRTAVFARAYWRHLRGHRAEGNTWLGEPGKLDNARKVSEKEDRGKCPDPVEKRCESRTIYYSTTLNLQDLVAVWPHGSVATIFTLVQPRRSGVRGM